MDFRMGDGILIKPDFYKGKEIPKHTLRGIVKDVKWNMLNIKFDNGETEWIESKYIFLERPNDRTSSKIK